MLLTFFLQEETVTTALVKAVSDWAFLCCQEGRDDEASQILGSVITAAARAVRRLAARWPPSTFATLSLWASLHALARLFCLPGPSPAHASHRVDRRPASSHRRLWCLPAAHPIGELGHPWRLSRGVLHYALLPNAADTAALNALAAC